MFLLTSSDDREWRQMFGSVRIKTLYNLWKPESFIFDTLREKNMNKKKHKILNISVPEVTVKKMLCNFTTLY